MRVFLRNILPVIKAVVFIIILPIYSCKLNSEINGKYLFYSHKKTSLSSHYKIKIKGDKLMVSYYYLSISDKDTKEKKIVTFYPYVYERDTLFAYDDLITKKEKYLIIVPTYGTLTIFQQDSLGNIKNSVFHKK